MLRCCVKTISASDVTNKARVAYYLLLISILCSISLFSALFVLVLYGQSIFCFNRTFELYLYILSPSLLSYIFVPEVSNPNLIKLNYNVECVKYTSTLPKCKNQTKATNWSPSQRENCTPKACFSSLITKKICTSSMIMEAILNSKTY